MAIFLSWRFFFELCITEARQALKQKIVKQAMISMQRIAAEKLWKNCLINEEKFKTKVILTLSQIGDI